VGLVEPAGRSGFSKWQRIYNALANAQNSTATGNLAMKLIQTILSPRRFVHKAAEFDEARAGQTVTLTGFSTANEFPFRRTPGALNDNFFGNTNGLVLRRSSPSNQLRSPLNAPMDLTPEPF